MKKKAVVLLSVLLAGAAVFAGAFYLGTRYAGTADPAVMISEPTQEGSRQLKLSESGPESAASRSSEAPPAPEFSSDAAPSEPASVPSAPDTQKPDAGQTSASSAAVSTLEPAEPPVQSASTQPAAPTPQPVQEPAATVDADTRIISFDVQMPGGGATAPDRGENSHGAVKPDERPEYSAPEIDWVDLDDYAEQVLSLTNRERTAAGLNELKTDSTLSAMAMARAREQEESYSHTRPDGTNSNTIYEEFDSDLTPYGENIHKGVKTPKAAVKDWMDSSGHKANILREGAEYIGVGVWQDDGGRLYWVQLFAVDK